MMFLPSDTRVYLAPGTTDMRKAINGLSIMVEASLKENPFSGHLFVFCNRRRNIIKILYYDRNGFCLWQKRLEKHRFKWPANEKQALKISQRQLSFILDGLDMNSIKTYESIPYKTLL